MIDAYYTTSSAMRETENGTEMVPKVFRVSSFLPVNIPIVMLMLFSPPTIKATMGVQFVNQSFMAGLNYANKNPLSKFTNTDLAKAYLAATSSSMLISVGIRKAMSGLTRSATGNRLIALNAIVFTISSAFATVLNTYCIRKAEIDQGIQIYSSRDLNANSNLGISSKCAE